MLMIPSYSVLRKTHEFSLLLKNRIEKGQTLGFFTHRNLLDIIASHIEKGWINDVKSFVDEYGLEKLVYRAIILSKIKGLIIIPYDELMENKMNVIKMISKRLNVELNEEQVHDIIKETSIENTKMKIKNLNFEKVGNDLFDKKTGLHKNHINNPQTGKWQNVLNPNEIDLIVNNKAFKLFNTTFGYSNFS
jgi:hypothetical protein